MDIYELKKQYLDDEKLIEDCEKICKEHKEVLKYYLNNYEVIKQSATIEPTKFGNGGSIINRGYYCPSPTFDMTCSNVRRGRLSDKPTNETIYKYRFDSSNRLVCVEKNKEFTDMEYIWYKDNIQYGVLMESVNLKEKHISCVSMCYYDNKNRISKYECSEMGPSNEELGYTVANAEIEEYFYKDDILSTVVRYAYYRYTGNKTILDKEIYEFNRDENSKIISYKVLRFKTDEQTYEGIGKIPRSKQRVIEDMEILKL